MIWLFSNPCYLKTISRFSKLWQGRVSLNHTIELNIYFHANQVNDFFEMKPFLLIDWVCEPNIRSWPPLLVSPTIYSFIMKSLQLVIKSVLIRSHQPRLVRLVVVYFL